MNFYLPTEIITGKDCIRQNAGLFSQLGKACLIVTGKSSAKKCGALKDVCDTLESVGIEYKVYDKITQNPLMSDCMEGGKIARECGAEFIIGIGGGSPLDAAKAIAVFATNDIDEVGLYAKKWERKPLGVVAVGTTAGTGSEVTQVAVITSSKGLKKSFRDKASFPVLAFGDATYTEFMPERVTRSTAIDALSHCIESYFCNNSNDFSRQAAKRGSKLIVNELYKIKDGVTLDFKARENLYLASLYGGIAISVTGTSFPHALGYFLTENHGIAHGSACAVYLSEFIRYNCENAKELWDEFEKSVGITASELCALIEKSVPEIEISITKEQVDELYPRWINCTCLPKMYGIADADTLQNIVIKCVLK